MGKRGVFSKRRLSPSHDGFLFPFLFSKAGSGKCYLWSYAFFYIFFVGAHVSFSLACVWKFVGFGASRERECLFGGSVDTLIRNIMIFSKAMFLTQFPTWRILLMMASISSDGVSLYILLY
jgi:hypothetical protein